MPHKKLKITVNIEYLPELPPQQQIQWDRYYQKLFSDTSILLNKSVN